jgi:hypothetical protein
MQKYLTEVEMASILECRFSDGISGKAMLTVINMNTFSPND